MTDLQNIIADIGAQATTLQNQAANPIINIWVNASAGTGKTKVLTDRVLRLLLPTDTHDGTPPENILCLTFTKAGASEMITRVMKTLSKWAVCSESDLYSALEKLLGHRPSLSQSDRARQLFATIIDTPEGLNITTIHAFCQSVLGRFTMEAGLPPNFRVMEEAETAQIIKSTRNELITNCLDGDADKDVRDAFQWLAGLKNADQISKLFGSILNDRYRIAEFLTAGDDIKSTIYTLLDVGVNDNEKTIFEAYFSDDVFAKNKIEKLATALDHGTDKNKELAKRLNAFCNAPIQFRENMIVEYLSIFLTQKNELASIKKITKGAREFDPTSDDIFIDEGKRLLNYKDRLNSYFIAQSTIKLLSIARDIITRYDRHKKQSQKLDYDDLIVKTHALLSGDMRDWVLYKMDHRIDHILVDEAQDTSPAQWSIISELLNEFFSGMSARQDDVQRTIFAVGDKKQSIFSFQGADPQVFADVQGRVETQIQNADKSFKNIPMDTSFRSTPAILNAVDAVFKPYDAYTTHTSYRQGQSGRVDLWLPCKAEEQEKSEPWTLPIDVTDAQDSNAMLANDIANKMAQWIKGKEILKSKNRPIHAGDIMVLVRRRNAFVEHLTRALKKQNIPVSGADRLVIINHIAVQDVLSVLSFAMMPDDDLALAEILKSPFIGFDDTTIEDMAYNRQGTLWNAVKSSSYDDVIAYLKNIIETISGQNAFMAASDILNRRTPNNRESGWKAMMGRLGTDAIDPLEELLSMAQNFDTNNPATGIQGFLHMAQSNQSDIKRELEGAGDMVRIMTVHASKGLQAPIVILPDTLSMPKSSGQSDDGIQWINDNFPLWTTSSDVQNDTLKSYKDTQSQAGIAEYHRLLYVAMTRAEDRLIVCGALNKKQKNAPDESWYQLVENGFANLDFCEDDQGQKFYETSQDIKVDGQDNKKAIQEISILPEWITHDIKPEQHPPKILKPSQDNSESVPVRSPLTHTDDTYRYRRGNLTHSLLQYLPDIAIGQRSQSAQDYLDKQAPDLSVEIKQSIKDESLKILNDPQFEKFFGEGSLAEIPLTGIVGDTIISGQIDRMLVTDNEIWIVDFKSNRPPPRDPNKIPNVYRKQLAAYKTLIADIYPLHHIHCALLWTDGPYMMELNVD